MCYMLWNSLCNYVELCEADATHVRSDHYETDSTVFFWGYNKHISTKGARQQCQASQNTLYDILLELSMLTYTYQK